MFKARNLETQHREAQMSGLGSMPPPHQDTPTLLSIRRLRATNTNIDLFDKGAALTRST